MDNYTAIGIAEGFIDADSEEQVIEAWESLIDSGLAEEQVIEAWQTLIDSGLAWKLQGSFGRTASHLIGIGVCREPHETH
jgi:hypothetical protein